ncbi:GPI transamidase component PIG-T [Echinococcus granulosus]|uniref:GPI transamidase component PIG-T n=1 Tax=Echinococcus granulosus TaxID=6210 RepID=W6UNG2_ECHGR|nr:GPI transamidase component PIG-T [Echinococcus granulosus]EUB59802.1 GPI transamidase component PIG-T [Echinococcus granulosus]
MQRFVHFFVIGLTLALADHFEEELLVRDLGNGFSGFHFNLVTRKTTSGEPYSVDKSWAYFLEALSGQFCASLSQLGLPHSYISPLMSYRPSGLTQQLTFNNASEIFRYAQLPHEEVCTENLTPWSKLLPCKKLGGLASMLKPKSIFKAAYNAMYIGVRRVCSGSQCKQSSLELRQSLTFVFDRRYSYSSVQESWSLTGLLGGRINKSCQIARRSEIIILHSQSRLDLKPSGSSSLVSWDSHRVLAVYTPAHDFANDLTITSVPPVETSRFSTGTGDSISVMKYATGRGDIDGGVRIELCNHLSLPTRAILLDSSPWYAEIYFSSLSVAYQSEMNDAPINMAPDRVIFQPSVQLEQMAFLELLLTLPSRACVTVSYAFKKILMHWNEYLPDANHGIFLPAATVIYQLSPDQLNRQRAASNPITWELSLPPRASTYAEYLSAVNHTELEIGEGFVRLYSETPLIRLPVPDFSMPFNALCLVCSVVALLFGGVHKLTTSAMVPVIAEGDEEVVDKPPIVRLCQKLKAVLRTKLAAAQQTCRIGEPLHDPQIHRNMQTTRMEHSTFYLTTVSEAPPTL